MTPDFDDAEQTFLDPETVYRAIAYAPDGSIPAWIDDTHTVVARPGEAPLTPPAVGDVLIRVALGQRGLGRTSILLESAAGAPVVLDDALVAVERGGPGAYALVVDSGEAGGTGPGPRPIERRLLDPEGHMPRGQLLLRAKREASSDPDEMFAEDDKYEQLLAHLRRELSLSFTDPNDPGLLDRRRRLRAIFAEVPPQRTRELHQRLGARPTADELSRAFHGRLATPTRAELLKILQDRFPAVAPATAPPPPASPPLPDTSKPLPADAERRYRTALAALEQKVAASTDPRVWRYRCWLSKLKAGGDDRVIKWHRICPRTSGALGAAYIVGPCDITAGSAVDQAQLQRSIHSVADVEVANRQLGFITHLRSHILFTHELTSMHLENLRMLHDQVIETVDKLGNWANNPMGGSSAMPAAYVAIKDWIGARQRDPNSVYSCL